MSKLSQFSITRMMFWSSANASMYLTMLSWLSDLSRLASATAVSFSEGPRFGLAIFLLTMRLPEGRCVTRKTWPGELTEGAGADVPLLLVGLVVFADRMHCCWGAERGSIGVQMGGL